MKYGNQRLLIVADGAAFGSEMSKVYKPIEDMPDFLEKSELVFFKAAKYCEEHDVNFLIQYPCTSIEI